MAFFNPQILANVASPPPQRATPYMGPRGQTLRLGNSTGGYNYSPNPFQGNMGLKMPQQPMMQQPMAPNGGQLPGMQNQMLQAQALRSRGVR